MDSHDVYIFKDTDDIYIVVLEYHSRSPIALLEIYQITADSLLEVS